MSRRTVGATLSAVTLLGCLLLPSLPTGAAASAPLAARVKTVTVVGPVHVRAVQTLDAHQHAAARFHRGEQLSLRIRWQVLSVHKGDREVVLWMVRVGRQVVYRHYHKAAAQVGRWHWTTSVRLPTTGTLGVYTFEGKVVIGHKASWRVLTFRVVH